MLITDLDRRVGSAGIGGDDPERWSAIPYQGEGVAGVMLGCREGIHPAALTLRLDVAGPHRIWVGVYSFLDQSRIRLRLSGDRCCREIGAPVKLERISQPVLQEVFWKEADLTGQDLILEGAYRPDGHPGALAYLRLEPLERRVRERPQVRHPLAITEDGYGIFGRLPHTRPDDLLESFEAIPQDSCMRMLLWGSGNGDICNYPTRVGTYQPSAPGPCLSHFYDTLYRNRRLWRERGWNSLEVVRDYAAGADGSSRCTCGWRLSGPSILSSASGLPSSSSIRSTTVWIARGTLWPDSATRTLECRNTCWT